MLFSSSMTSILNSISNWWNNTVIQSMYNPAADQLAQLYRQGVSDNITKLEQTASQLGGGLGSAILSIPGIGKPIVSGLNALQAEAQQVLIDAKSMTPDQIATANDTINQKYQKLLAEAKAAGTAPPETPIKEVEITIVSFFTNVFSNTLYICIFVAVIILAFIGSSFAANNAFGKPNPIIIYYMVYGFLLFPIPLALSLFKYLNNSFKIYALWAPLHKGSSGFGLYDIFFSYPANYDSTPSHFTTTSLVAPRSEMV